MRPTKAKASLPEYDTPFHRALPPIPTLKQIQANFDRPPLATPADRGMPAEMRMHAVLRLARYSQPTVTSRTLALNIDFLIRQGYIGRNPETTRWARGLEKLAGVEAAARARKLDSLGWLSGSAPVDDTALTLATIGPPGTGKTHSLRTCLKMYPQVVTHCKAGLLTQIIWLRVECPSDGSLKSLASFFFQAVDQALREAGFHSNYESDYKTATLNRMMAGMARVANLHAIGLLAIDEIQHVKLPKTGGSEFLNFLVALRNTIGIPVLIIGTTAAVPILRRTFRDARRADGFGSIIFSRMQHDRSDDDDAPLTEFEGFVKRMWRVQYTRERTDLTPEIVDRLFEETQGVTDLVVKLFMLVQLELIESASVTNGAEVISSDIIRDVAEARFQIVRPFIKALRENDEVALMQCDDLADFHKLFRDYVSGIGNPEGASMTDLAFGSEQPLPPAVVDGCLRSDVVDAVLESLGVTQQRRDRFVTTHALVIEAGRLDELITAAKAEVNAARALPSAPKPKKPPKAAEEVPGDLRGVLTGAENAAELQDRLLGVGTADID